MGHHHHHHGSKGLRMAFGLNLVFTIIEFAGGYYTNSMAILSDALHDLGDTFALGLGLLLEYFSGKTGNRNYSYGYRRLSTVSALVNSLILIVGSVIIIYHAVPRFISPEPVMADGMMLLAVVGIVFNGAAVFQLSKGHGLNQKVFRLHLLEDVLGWVAVLIGGSIIYAFGWYIIDPLLSLAVAGFILFNAVKNLWLALKIFLQAVPANVDLTNVRHDLLKLEGVKDIHDLQIWTMDGEYHVLTMHLVVPDDLEQEKLLYVKNEARRIVKECGINHQTIEIEYEREHCANE